MHKLFLNVRRQFCFMYLHVQKALRCDLRTCGSKKKAANSTALCRLNIFSLLVFGLFHT